MNKRKIKFNAFIPKLGIMLENITIYGNGQMGYDCDSFMSVLPENFKADTSDGAVMELVKNEERGDIEEIPVCPIYYREDWVFINEEDYIPLQFIGSKDKNEREIFEGDILKIGGDKSIVVVEWCKRFASFALNRKDCEVIGNIYKNPELLTNK